MGFKIEDLGFRIWPGCRFVDLALCNVLVPVTKLVSVSSLLLRAPRYFTPFTRNLFFTKRGSIYSTIMELGPKNHSGDGLWGPNSIMVVYMEPLG